MEQLHSDVLVAVQVYIVIKQKRRGQKFPVRDVLVALWADYSTGILPCQALFQKFFRPSGAGRTPACSSVCALS